LHWKKILLLSIFSQIFLHSPHRAVAQDEDPNAPKVVMLWPEEGHVFRSGHKIIAAVVATRFDTPREGHIELLMSGNSAANFTPEAMDGEVKS
jgi:hypothetical protein